MSHRTPSVLECAVVLFSQQVTGVNIAPQTAGIFRQSSVNQRVPYSPYATSIRFPTGTKFTTNHSKLISTRHTAPKSTGPCRRRHNRAEPSGSYLYPSCAAYAHYCGYRARSKTLKYRKAPKTEHFRLSPHHSALIYISSSTPECATRYRTGSRGRRSWIR